MDRWRIGQMNYLSLQSQSDRSYSLTIHQDAFEDARDSKDVKSSSSAEMIVLLAFQGCLAKMIAQC